MKNKFNVIERFVTATPRSKRLAGSVTNGGVVISGSDGAGNSAVDPNSHTHANYELLEKLSEQDRQFCGSYASCQNISECQQAATDDPT